MNPVSATWIPRPLPEEPPASCHGEFPPILRQLLHQRGLLEEGSDLRPFLNPRLNDLGDPLLLPDMPAAVGRILEAIDRGEPVCIFGDYDVDGVTSVALLSQILRAYGACPRTFIPKRSSEGYSLTPAAIERCLAEGPKPALMITVDCGTSAVGNIQQLKALGIDVVVVDHHEPNPDGLPDCVAVVNPKHPAYQIDGGFQQPGYLCAAGVVFKLAHALLKTRPLPGLDLREFIDLVAVATISDIVPLVGENRILVAHGLRRLPNTINHGLRALQELTGMQAPMTSMDVGFRIGPRLNAAGRMDRAEDALATLLSESPAQARVLAQRLDDYNRQRQQHEKEIQQEALDMLAEQFDPHNDPVIVLGSRRWHPGVVGIVASRLMRQFHKPTFVIAIDAHGSGKGSGRSIEGVSLVEAIAACRADLQAGGGHVMAAGLSIQEEKIDTFRANFANYVRTTTVAEECQPRLYVDAEVPLHELTLEFLDSYDLLQPFGSGNPQPIFMARNVHLDETPAELKNQHLRLQLRQGAASHQAIFFGAARRELPPLPWDVAFTIDRNTFRGRTSLQIIVQDIRASLPAGS